LTNITPYGSYDDEPKLFKISSIIFCANESVTTVLTFILFTNFGTVVLPVTYVSIISGACRSVRPVPEISKNVNPCYSLRGCQLL